MSSIDDYLKKNGRPHLSIVPNDGGGPGTDPARLRARIDAIANSAPPAARSVAEARASFGVSPPTPYQMSTPEGKALRGYVTDDSALQERLAQPAAQAPRQAGAKFSRVAQAAEQAVATAPPAAAPASVTPLHQPAAAPASNPIATPSTAGSAAMSKEAKAFQQAGGGRALPAQVGNPSLVTKLRQAMGLVDGQAGTASVGNAINGGRPTPTASVAAAARQATAARAAAAQPGAFARSVPNALGSAEQWKQTGNKVAGAAGRVAGAAGGAAAGLGQAARKLAPLAKVGGGVMGGVMGVMEVADGVKNKDAAQVALGGADLAATGALATPAAPAAGVYLGARAAHNVIDQSLSEDSKDTIGGTINEVVQGAGRLLGQEWGVDGTNYEVMRAAAARQQAQAGAAPAVPAKPAAKPAPSAAPAAAAPAASTPANGGGARQGGRGGGAGGGGGGTGAGGGRGRKIATAAAAAALPAAAAPALSAEDEALAAQVADVASGVGPDGQGGGTIYTLADGSKFSSLDMTPEQQAIAAAHQARLMRETELYMQQVAAGQRQEPVVIDGGMATTMSGVTMPQSVYEAGMARQYADTANQAAVRNADPIAAEAALFKETEGATRQAVANTQAGAQIRSAQIAAANDAERLKIEKNRRYQRAGGGHDQDTGMKLPDVFFDEQKGVYINPRPPTMPIPDERAIQYLKKNPHTAPQFDQTYGAGAAERYYRN
ncbi:MAG: hypothetical protein ACXWVD_00295 [Telluria sp.]